MELTGEPYYYFWTSNVEEIQTEQQRLESQVQALRRAGRIAESNQVVLQINGMTPTVTEVTSLTQRLKRERGAFVDPFCTLRTALNQFLVNAT